MGSAGKLCRNKRHPKAAKNETYRYDERRMGKANVVFFDVGNTLLFPNRERILAPLAERGIVPTLEQWQGIERRTKQEFDAAMQGGAVDHGFWFDFYTHLLEEVGLAGDEEVRTALVNSTRVSNSWDQPRPGTTEALQQLGKLRRMAVISNADGKIAEVLERCQIATCFETITDSGIVGVEKPHPDIFKAALENTGATAEESVYVGDVYSVDFLGATAVGMQAVVFDVCGAYREMNVPRVESLEELESKLEEISQ